MVNKKEQWQQKMAAGYAFSTFNAYWETDTINTTLAASVGPDAQFYPYKVVADGLTADQTTYNGRSSLGWDAIAITKNCKHVDAALRLYDYLASEEGQYLLLWGIEGKDWNMVDGKHVPDQEVLDGLLHDFDNTSNEPASASGPGSSRTATARTAPPTTCPPSISCRPPAPSPTRCLGIRIITTPSTTTAWSRWAAACWASSGRRSPTS